MPVPQAHAQESARGPRRPAHAWPAVLLALLLPLGAATAATLEPPPVLADHGEVGWTTTYLGSIPRDAGTIISAPLRADARAWSITAGLAGMGLVLYATDARTNRWVQRHRTATSDRLARDVQPFGSTYLLYELGAFAVASPFVDDPRVPRTALLGTESIVFAMAGYEVLQLAVNRSRPSQGATRDTWSGPSFPSHGHSFPSGHATAAFAMATVVADEWHGVPGVAPVAYALATGVAAARMDLNAHWASDVVAGAVLGWAMATGVERCHPRGAHLAIQPLFDGRHEGLRLTCRW